MALILNFCYILFIPLLWMYMNADFHIECGTVGTIIYQSFDTTDVNLSLK